MRVLVTGGAGYIGSHTAKALARAGYEPVVYDNLSEGHKWAVKWGALVEGELSDRQRLDQVLRQHSIRAVMHFAAHAYVAESMREPRRYFQNNVSNTLVLLDAMLDASIKTIVFSSSCAVYGVPDVIPIPESHPKRPLNPYGESKLFIERVLDWYGASYGLRSATLRYFNAAGADPDLDTGELHHHETHIVPLVIETALGRRKEVKIYGTDYPTPDGTAIRDFIHVSDLADAHVLALNHLLGGNANCAVNLGTGNGVSVLEIVRAIENYTGISVEARSAPRRPGDAPALVANPSQAVELLGWHPTRSTVEGIVSSAWRWHKLMSESKIEDGACRQTAAPAESHAPDRLA